MRELIGTLVGHVWDPLSKNDKYAPVADECYHAQPPQNTGVSSIRLRLNDESSMSRRWLQPLLAAIVLTLAPACETGSTANEYISDAQTAIDAERYGQARSLADRAVEHGAEPNDRRLERIRAAIIRGSAEAARDEANLERAATLFREAAEEEPAETKAADDYLQLARIQKQLDQSPADIAETAELAIDRNPGLRPAYRLAGRMWDRAGNADRAVERYLWAFEADRTDSQIGFRLGSLYRQMDKPVDAISIFERLLAHDSDHVQARVNLAELYELVDRPSQAKQQYETLIERHPESSGILRRYAEFLEQRGETSRARKIMQRAREAMPAVEQRNMRELQ